MPGGETNQPIARAEGEIAAEAVIAFLRRHPDFLAKHPDLMVGPLAAAPRRSDGSYDFQSFLLHKLRHEAEIARAANRELIGTTRANLAAQRRVHRAALALLGAVDFAHFIEIVGTDLAVHLDLDVVLVCVECDGTKAPPPDRFGVRLLEPGTVGSLFAADQGVVLTGAGKMDEQVFGGAAPLARSSALVRLRLGQETPSALLALGSRKPGHFHPKQGIELLTFLGEIVERCFGLWLDFPSHAASRATPR
jgi:uncharacterized protein YigA (DUF484 family)